jgi:hypothetical protein
MHRSKTASSFDRISGMIENPKPMIKISVEVILASELSQRMNPVGWFPVCMTLHPPLALRITVVS